MAKSAPLRHVGYIDTQRSPCWLRRPEGVRTLMIRDFGLSFIAGLLVGVLYGIVRVKSPAPPLVALLGLLGMVIGEYLAARLHTLHHG